MDYATALKSVRKHGLSMVADRGNNIRMVAVGSKDAGPLCNVKDFCVTAFVSRKLTKKELKAQGMHPFQNLYTNAAHDHPAFFARSAVIFPDTRDRQSLVCSHRQSRWINYDLDSDRFPVLSFSPAEA